MTLTEFMERLSEMYPKFPWQAWRPEFKRVLGNVPGEALADAFNATMNDWTKPTPPKPAHFAENVRDMRATASGQKLRPAGTENEARAWTETHPYMRGTFNADWRHVLVSQDFSGSMAAQPWTPPTDEDRSGVAELVREALHKTVPPAQLEHDEPLPPKADQPVPR